MWSYLSLLLSLLYHYLLSSNIPFQVCYKKKPYIIIPSAPHFFVWIYISIWYLCFLSDIFLLPFAFFGSWIYGDTLLYSWSTDLNKFCKIKKVTILPSVLEDIFIGYRTLVDILFFFSNFKCSFIIFSLHQF